MQVQDSVRQWLEPMVEELFRRGSIEDVIAALLAVDTSRLPAGALEMLVGIRGEKIGESTDLAESVDWVAVGAVLREALQWHAYPETPPSEN